MDTKIKAGTWSSAEFEALGPEGKLTVLWLQTCGYRDMCGIVCATLKRFHFETGLDESWLWRTVQALPRALKGFEGLGMIYIRDYIGDQLGRGNKLKNNNIFRAVVSAANSIRHQEVLDCLLADYPEFEGEMEALHKGLATPPQGVRAREGESTGEGDQGKEVQEKGEPKETLPDVPATAKPGRPKKIKPPPDPKPPKDHADKDAVVAYCVEISLPASDGVFMFEKWEGNHWMNGGNKIKDWKAVIRSWRAASYLPSQKQGGNGSHSKQPASAGKGGLTRDFGRPQESIEEETPIS